MAWQHIRISRFGGPEVLELAEQQSIHPGPGEVRIKVLAAGTGFTDTFIRRGRYPDFKGPLPFTPGYELVGVVEQTGPGVTEPREGQAVADLCVIGGYAQYAIRPARFLVPVPDGVDLAKAVCIPLAYLTAFQMLTRYRHLSRGATILAVWRLGHRRHRATRSRASSWPKGNWHLLGREPACGRALRRHRDRLSRGRLRRACAAAHRRPKERRWRQWILPSTRSVARISTNRLPASRPAGYSSAMGRRPWRSGAKVWLPRRSGWAR